MEHTGKHWGIRLLSAALALCVCIGMFGCAKKDTDAPVEEATPAGVANAPQAAVVDTEVNLLYTNPDFMLEMLVNDDCEIEENGANIAVMSSAGNAVLILSLFPGIQNLTAGCNLALVALTNTFPNVKVSEFSQGMLFGALSKSCTYTAEQEWGIVAGMQAAAIINQSCYVLTVMFDPNVSDEEGLLITNVFNNINVVRPEQVDQASQTAVYTSAHPEAKPSKKSKAASVTEWDYLPYYYYSWWGDPGDYGDYPAWYFEPDWDYYSDPGDYWDWGWDEDNDWWFYDEYADYYDYDYYQGYDDYWETYYEYEDEYAYDEDYGYFDADDYFDAGDQGDPGDYYSEDYDDYGGYDDGDW